MTDAITGTGPHIMASRMRYPDDSWGSWTPGHGIETVAAELAGRLAEGSTAQALVRRSVTTINSDALRKDGSVTSLAIWVPDRSTGEVMAIVDLAIRGFPKGPADPDVFLSRNVKRDLGRRARLMDYTARRTTLPTGEATIEQYVLRLRGERQVQSYLVFSVFPPGAREALQLSFNTVHLNLMTSIAEQARITAESLTLTLGEIPGGRRAAR